MAGYGLRPAVSMLGPTLGGNTRREFQPERSALDHHRPAAVCSVQLLSEQYEPENGSDHRLFEVLRQSAGTARDQRHNQGYIYHRRRRRWALIHYALARLKNWQDAHTSSKDRVRKTTSKTAKSRR